MTSARLVLASGSPQRRAILAQLGLDFEVVVPDVEEVGEGEPAALVIENALRKARAVATDGESEAAVRGDRLALGAGTALVLAADTAVVLEGRVYGKPGDELEAERFLRALSGRTHEVHSGIAVIEQGKEQTASAVTEVRFRELDESMLRWYLDSREWDGRAGGYAIQGKGAALVEGIDGDYLNVVGLPVSTLLRLKPSLPLSHR